MDRRIVLAGLAAFAAGPAPAQASGAGSVANSAGSAMPAGQAGAMGAARLGQAEMQHMQQTLQIGSVALETSRLAQQKARNENLKQFAGFEVAEQTTIAQVLTDEPDPPAAVLDPAHQAMLQRLVAASDPAFDREYVLGQLQGHQELFQIQQAFLQNQPSMGTDAVHIAMLARTTIQMHLVMLQELQRVVQG